MLLVRTPPNSRNAKAVPYRHSSLLASRAEARPTGRAVFRERLGDCDGPMAGAEVEALFGFIYTGRVDRVDCSRVSVMLVLCSMLDARGGKPGRRRRRRRSCAPLCLPTRQAGHMAKRRVGVEYSPSMLEPVRPGAVSPDRALCLPTFSHFVIVNKTSLSLPPHILFINTQEMITISLETPFTVHGNGW